MIKMNELYKKLLEAYKKHRQTVAFDDKNAYEIYKWQLITVCQNKTPFEIVCTHNSNPTKAEKGGFVNLIDAIHDNAVLKYLANNKAKELESVLNNLINESYPLNDRLMGFKVSMSEMLQGTNFKSKANDERTAATILTCFKPQKYTLYKDKVYQKLCDYLRILPEKTGKKYQHYLSLIEPLVQLIKKDSELHSIIINSPINGLLQSDLLLAQDICWELLEHFPHELSKYKTMSTNYQKYKTLLEKTHNLILTGAPGTGKTYLAKEIAKSMGCTDNEIGFVQFHPSYDYSDFVEGLRPMQDDNGNAGFERKDGVFKRFCATALNNLNKPFVFIIDEINRGEISKIFGELFFSIDPGYRGKAGIVQTQYQNIIEDGDTFKKGFFVPENVYIIGTMNDIDRSVESMDFAMRRRFAWKEVTAEDSMQMLDGLPNADILKKRMRNLNAQILKVEGLGKAYQIGAAYFKKYELYNSFDDLWNYHLEGLLREYLRGMSDVETKIAELKKAYDNESDNNNG